MFKKILVPTDGSEGARNAARMAADLARTTGGRLVALHVVAPDVPDVAYTGLGVIGAPVSLGGAAEVPAREVDPALVAVREAAREAGVPIEDAQVTDARPADAIAAVADQRGCDLIVMSSQRHAGFIAALAGSTSQRVFKGCDVPVLLVH